MSVSKKTVKRTDPLPRPEPKELPGPIVEFKCWNCEYTFQQTGPHYFACFCTHCHVPMKRVKK